MISVERLMVEYDAFEYLKTSFQHLEIILAKDLFEDEKDRF